jgi:hypothetical protein
LSHVGSHGAKMTAQGEHGNSGNLRKGRRGCAPPQFVEPPILRKLALINFVTLTRAREWCADTMSELGQQTDPLEPAGRRCGCWPTSPIPFYEVWLGANDGAGTGEVGGDGEVGGAGRAQRATGSSTTIAKFRSTDIREPSPKPSPRLVRKSAKTTSQCPGFC